MRVNKIYESDVRRALEYRFACPWESARAMIKIWITNWTHNDGSKNLEYVIFVCLLALRVAWFVPSIVWRQSTCWMYHDKTTARGLSVRTITAVEYINNRFKLCANRQPLYVCVLMLAQCRWRPRSWWRDTARGLASNNIKRYKLTTLWHASMLC